MSYCRTALRFLISGCVQVLSSQIWNRAGRSLLLLLLAGVFILAPVTYASGKQLPKPIFFVITGAVLFTIALWQIWRTYKERGGQ
jgi:uncharacterized membrane protein YfcA